MREQFGRARQAATRLGSAHLNLAKAEFSEIVGELKIIAAGAAGILAVAIFIGLLVAIGTPLFLGEWLFGSMGWGILHGLLFGIGVIAALGLLIVGAGGRPIGLGLGLAVLVGLIVAVLFGSNVLRTGALSLADGLTASFALDRNVLATLVGLVIGGLLLGVAGLVIGLRRGSGAVGSTIGLGIVGVLIGAILGFITFDWRGAVAVAVAIGLLLWPACAALLAWQTGRLDPAARFARLKPTRSIEAANETKEFLERQWAERRTKLSAK